jgi:hypothetical protein
MANPPAGYVKDPNTIDWWFDPNGDPGQQSSWWQCPPDGFEYDPANPHWALRTIGDAGNPGDWWHDATITDTPSGTLVPGIDVSSAQPTDLSALIARTGARHVCVKLYQRVELGGRGAAISKAQLTSAIQNGCSVSGYWWQYRDVPIEQQVQDALAIPAQMGIALPIVYSDAETYTDGTCPSGEQVKYGLGYVRDQGQRSALYTGLYVWRDHLGQIDLTGELLYSANYNGLPTLESSPGYGGMTVIAHQYADRDAQGPIDCDVFDASVV